MDYMTSNQLLGPEEDHKIGQRIAPNVAGSADR